MDTCNEFLPFDAAVIWLHEGDAHGTFHYAACVGYDSLQRWRDVKRLVEHIAFSKRLSLVEDCLEDEQSNTCDWCGNDDALCTCDFDSNGVRVCPFGSDKGWNER